ncbi:MAG TPA: class III lanthipeptide [Solirubrobacteraceae bacterium]|jgi:hypothetical protein|nr:class III lanthipeptide [Solirubrobacteraceae bacterium]
MPILDLQALPAPTKAHGGGKSGASKNCGNHFSGLSLLLC